MRTGPRIVLTILFVSRTVLSYTGDLETQLDMQSPDETEGSKRKENVYPDVTNGGFTFKPDITHRGRRWGFVLGVVSNDNPCHSVR